MQRATCNMQRAPCNVPRAAHHRQRRSTASRRTQAVKPCCTNAALPPACPCVPATARIVLEHARTGPSCVRHGARCTLRCASHDTWRYRSVVDDGPATTRSPCASASRLKLPPVAADGIRVRRAGRSQGLVLCVPRSRVPLSRVPLSPVPLSPVPLIPVPLSRFPLSRVPLSRVPLAVSR